MDKRAKILADLIDKRGSRRSFAEEIGLPPTTLQSILTRGIGKAAVDNVLKVCKALNISIEELEQLAETNCENYEIGTIAAHHDGEDWTDEEREEIESFKQFVRSRKKK
ncbi:helix-turn-helix transcriptional regulator [Paenibacillus sp. L3-i20]|uniref:helix-turn-helix domain-containing protein n=1 Tax=Paenibacillus sp. L3-i20 TaxID=2905833 RepID=UPI001EE0C553|nr:helix-turn-helix transcriptional regulator [Paenibacillus sp. L3-i20]GKU75663.1 hypothetical protein L3i20_v200600 [Paenibacillus sp. L3-i20]